LYIILKENQRQLQNREKKELEYDEVHPLPLLL
jgi:hypothetical protein